jgi:predicted enzyme related to lactoylglutathione lyase
MALNEPGPSLRMHAVVIDCAEFEPLVAFWSAALGYVEWFAPHGQFAGIKPPVRDGRLAIIFQRVPEPKVVKNRVHIDYEADAMEGEVDRLVALGGRAVRVVEMASDERWTIVEDPAGNEFCVTQG